jgi:hypothetical protein
MKDCRKLLAKLGAFGPPSGDVQLGGGSRIRIDPIAIVIE